MLRGKIPEREDPNVASQQMDDQRAEHIGRLHRVKVVVVPPVNITVVHDLPAAVSVRVDHSHSVAQTALCPWASAQELNAKALSAAKLAHQDHQNAMQCAKVAQAAEKDLRAKQKEHDWLQSQLDVLQLEMRDQRAKVEEQRQAEVAAKEAEHSHGLLYHEYLKHALAAASPSQAQKDTPHCAQQCPRTLAALQVSNETLPQREDYLASATDSGDDSSSCDDSVSASEASHGSYCWSDASKSDNVNSLPASDYTEDESLESDQEAAAGDGTAALGTQQGSDLRKPVVPGEAARPQASYRVAPKDVESFYLGRHEYGDERDHAIANLEKLEPGCVLSLCCRQNHCH
ncbi:hypothetical protein WJX79_006623 [Trebouxia sp. C0005]